MSKAIQQTLLTIHITLAVLWIYQGLVPKIIFKTTDEQRLWQYLFTDERLISILIEFAGYMEIAFGLLFLFFRQSQILHYFNIIAMIGLSLVVIIISPLYFTAAFNPFVMNLTMAILSVVALQIWKSSFKY